MTIKDYLNRRKFRKCIKDVFPLAHNIIINCSKIKAQELIRVIQEEILDDYVSKYGEDDFILFYLDRIQYFELIQKTKE